MSTLTKKDLAEALNVQGGWPKVRTAELLDELGALIAAGLARGDTVILPGLGRLSVTDTPERQGRNPRTGEAIAIPARRRVKFTPGKALKEDLNR